MTQKRLDEQAEHDINRYVENLHQIIQNIEKQHNLKFKYGSIKKIKDEELVIV